MPRLTIGKEDPKGRIYRKVRKISCEMLTSDSDDFESADEELRRGASKSDTRVCRRYVDSESDDELESDQRMPYRHSDWQSVSESFVTDSTAPDMATGQETSLNGMHDDKINSDVKVESGAALAALEKTCDSQKDNSWLVSAKLPTLPTPAVLSKDENAPAVVGSSSEIGKSTGTDMSGVTASQLAARNSTTEIRDEEKRDDVDESRIVEQADGCLAPSLHRELLESASKDMELSKLVMDKSKKTKLAEPVSAVPSKDLSEMDMPEELKSDKKFKEIFQSEGWDTFELPDELTEEKLQSVFEPPTERLLLANKEEPKSSSGSWSSWGNWDVTSLINTATASVSTLTNHVSQGLTLLENTIGIQDPIQEESVMNPTKQDKAVVPDDGADSKQIQEQSNQSYSSFGFGNLMSGVSSITRLVESTGSKVMTGGLDTLEAIGKKTMEVLQEGDPGLKKKRAFFMNEIEKPILSKILREAKERAEAELKEKTMEECELTRKIPFESLFDDYQGLVHLEALEMLSKQCDMKIQQYLIELDTNELIYMQEMLEQIKELCDGLVNEDDDDNDDDNNDTTVSSNIDKYDKNWTDRLKEPCHDLGIDITYKKLDDVWTEVNTYLATLSTYTDQEIFQKAISALAQFTALSVERFHKTAELLLIKERRNTVNEADALIQLKNILSDQIKLLANVLSKALIEFKTPENLHTIEDNMTTIISQGTDANAYIQDASKLLIPILQVGAI